MTLPTHPTGDRSATWFHGIMAGIGLLHVVGGLVMIAWHGTAAHRHWKDIQNGKEEVRKD